MNAVHALNMTVFHGNGDVRPVRRPTRALINRSASELPQRFDLLFGAIYDHHEIWPPLGATHSDDWRPVWSRALWRPADRGCPSRSGKTVLIASTNGSAKLPNGARIGLNVFRKANGSQESQP